MKNILDKAKQYIEAKKSEHPPGKLTITFDKPPGEENTYVWFGYSPQKTFNHTRRQVSGSMNSYPINANKHVTNQQRNDDNKKSKEQ